MTSLTNMASSMTAFSRSSKTKIVLIYKHMFARFHDLVKNYNASVSCLVKDIFDFPLSSYTLFCLFV